MRDHSPTIPVASPPSGWRLWWLAVRPRTLSIAVAPVLAGAGLAWAEAHRLAPLPLAATLLAAVLIQMGTNLWNDVADGLRGGDRPGRLGPPRVTAQGWASPGRVRGAALLCFALAAGLGLYLSVLGGWPILVLGGVSLLAGWAYSCGPRPLSATAFGELAVLAFFGVGAVAGTVWLQIQALPLAALATGVAVGLPAAAVLMVNNVRDLEQDRLNGRRTLAIRLGRHWAGKVYGVMLLAPFPLILGTFEGAWAVLAAVPWAGWLAWRFPSAEGRACNRFLSATASYQLVLAVLIQVVCVKQG